jgi:hypothetical protein
MGTLPYPVPHELFKLGNGRCLPVKSIHVIPCK